MVANESACIFFGTKGRGARLWWCFFSGEKSGARDEARRTSREGFPRASTRREGDLASDREVANSVPFHHDLS
jgi:hypothetical protein